MQRKTSSVAKIPIKRARKAPNRFAATEEETKPKIKPGSVEQKVLYYSKGDFLAVKSDEGKIAINYWELEISLF